MLFRLAQLLFYPCPYLAHFLLQAVRTAAQGDSALLALMGSFCRIKAVLLALVAVLVWALLLELALSPEQLPSTVWLALALFGHLNLCLAFALDLVSGRLRQDSR